MRNCGALVLTPNFFSSVRRNPASASCASVYCGANFWIAWQMVRRWNGLDRSSSRSWYVSTALPRASMAALRIRSSVKSISQR
ncbi:hypothetical protein D9M72_536170 [compost metagenome]